LREEHHVPVIDADILARQVVGPGTRGYKRILRAFGEEVILQDGSGKIDRKKLGEIVFGDEEKRRVLNGIVHPEVRWEMLKEVVRCWWRGEARVVLDVPLLIESGIYRWVGEVVVVYWCVMPLLVGGSADSGSPEQEQLARLMSRDGIGAEVARARMEAQMGIEEKKGYATVVLDNSGGVAELQRQVAVVVKALRLSQLLDIQ
jgi:dephospho-CoA kinase